MKKTSFHFIGHIDYSIANREEAYQKHAPPGYKFLGYGRTRAVYLKGRVVLKIPLTEYDVGSNSEEYKIFRKWNKSKKNPDEAAYARCRLLKNGWLLMEYVEPIGDYKDTPEWTGFIDCCQVGTTITGKIVAYDYGL